MDDIAAVINHVINENEAIVNNWLADKPGSWGALSGKVVVAAGRQLGRSLNDAEKRIVWQALWDKLIKLKKTHE